MNIKFANNASSYLVDAVSDTSSILNVLPGTGLLFPTLVDKDDYFLVTVVDTDANMEIMKVTAKNGDSFTVVRGQENTTPRQFTINSIIENRLTAGSIMSVLNAADASETSAGRVRLATREEVNAGTSKTVAVTPYSLSHIRMPKGSIIMFSGSFSANGIPYDSATGEYRIDWRTCDGSNGTPDLRDKFVIGASSSKPQGSASAGTMKFNPVANIKIQESTLTVSQLPGHEHHIPVTHGWAGNASGLITAGTASNKTFAKQTDITGGTVPHNHGITSTQDIELTPPYYSLSYIMKVI